MRGCGDEERQRPREAGASRGRSHFRIPPSPHPPIPANHTTTFSSLPGTKITFFGVPVTNFATSGSASAARQASSWRRRFATLHRAAHLAVHLHGQLVIVFRGERRVVRRPARVEHAASRGRAVPQLLGDVRRERAPRAARAASLRASAARARRRAACSCTPSSPRSPCCSSAAAMSSPTFGSSGAACASPPRRARRRRRASVAPTPEPVEEAPHAGDALVAEVAALLERPQEHQVRAEGVRAPLARCTRRGSRRCPALRHLRAVADDQPVRAESLERLLEVEKPRVVQHHRDEARVQQVQHGVLVAADVASPPAASASVLLRVERHVVAVARSDSAGSTTRCRGRCRTRRSRAAPCSPHCGHGTRYHSSWRASGDTPVSSGRKSSMSRQHAPAGPVSGTGTAARTSSQ